MFRCHPVMIAGDELCPNIGHLSVVSGLLLEVGNSFKFENVCPKSKRVWTRGRYCILGDLFKSYSTCPE